MSIHYPGSFLKLLLIGFAFAIFPLLWAFTNANIAFDKLAEQSEITIYNAVKTTRAVRILQEQAYLMERSIRQYYVLQDDTLFKNYQQADIKFDAAIVELQQLTTYRPQLENINSLRQQTQQLNQLIQDSIGTQTSQLDFLDTFSQLRQQIEVIIEENTQGVHCGFIPPQTSVEYQRLLGYSKEAHLPKHSAEIKGLVNSLDSSIIS